MHRSADHHQPQRPVQPLHSKAKPLARRRYKPECGSWNASAQVSARLGPTSSSARPFAWQAPDTTWTLFHHRTADSLSPFHLLRAACQSLGFCDYWHMVADTAIVQIVLLAALEAEQRSTPTIPPSLVLKQSAKVCAAGCPPPYTDLEPCQGCGKVAHCSPDCMLWHMAEHHGLCQLLQDSRLVDGTFWDGCFASSPQLVPLAGDVQPMDGRSTAAMAHLNGQGLQQLLQTIRTAFAAAHVAPAHRVLHMASTPMSVWELVQAQPLGVAEKYITQFRDSSQLASQAVQDAAHRHTGVVWAAMTALADSVSAKYPQDYPPSDVKAYLARIKAAQLALRGSDRQNMHTRVFNRAKQGYKGSPKVPQLWAACDAHLQHPQSYAVSQSALVESVDSCAVRPEEWPTPALSLLGLCGHCNSIDAVGWCAACRSVGYCCKDCQQADWGNHRRFCSKITARLLRDLPWPFVLTSLLFGSGRKDACEGTLLYVPPGTSDFSTLPALCLLRLTELITMARSYLDAYILLDSCHEPRGPVAPQRLETAEAWGQGLARLADVWCDWAMDAFLELKRGPDSPELADQSDEQHLCDAATCPPGQSTAGQSAAGHQSPVVAASQTGHRDMPGPAAGLAATCQLGQSGSRAAATSPPVTAASQADTQGPQAVVCDAPDPEAIASACREMLAENPTVQRIAEVMLDGAPVEASEDEHMVGLQLLLMAACMCDEVDMQQVVV